MKKTFFWFPILLILGAGGSCSFFPGFNPAAPLQGNPNISAHPSLELAVVPGGTGFEMGYTGISNAAPVHTVAAISAFSMGKYEITNELWYFIRAWALDNGYVFEETSVADYTAVGPMGSISRRDCLAWCNALSEWMKLTPCYYTENTHTKVFRDTSGTAVISNDCVIWGADGYRLPTEAEWEYAARYQDGKTWTAGDQHSGAENDDNPENCAWYSSNSEDTVQPGGELTPNSLGIYDMSGNVKEWVWDYYGTYTIDSPYTDVDPRGPDSGTDYIHRGGGYDSPVADLDTAVRISTPIGAYPSVGFRVVRKE